MCRTQIGRIAPGACIVCALLLVNGCDGEPVDRDAGSMVDAAIDSPADAGAPSDAPSDIVDAAVDPCAAPSVVFEQRWASWRDGDLVDSLGRLVGIPDVLDPSLAAIPVIEPGAKSSVVHVLRVLGEVPRGRLYAVAWSRRLDRAIALVIPSGGGPPVVATITLGPDSATFDTFVAVGGPSGDERGAWLHAVDDAGDAVLLTGDGFQLLHLDASRARWDAFASVPPTFNILGHHGVDAERARVVTLYTARSAVDLTIDPAVHELELAGSRAYRQVPMSGPPPPPTDIFAPEVRWDPARRRFLTVQPSSDGDGVWSADLETRSWTEIVPGAYAPGVNIPQALDVAGDRYLGVYVDDVITWAIAPGSEGAVSRLPIDGVHDLRFDLQPVATDRVLVVARGRRLVAMDLDAEVPGWSWLGAAELPVDDGASLAWDPVRRRILAFGGTVRAMPLVRSDALLEIDEAGSSVTEVMTTGDAPPPVGDSRAIVVDDQLVLVAMIHDGATVHGELHVLDLESRVWRAPGVTVSAYPTLVRRGDGHVWIVARDGQVSDLDLRTNTVVAVEVRGEPPSTEASTQWAPLAGGAVAVEGYRGDLDDAALWQLVPTDDGACWVGGRSGLTSLAFLSAAGTFDDERGHFVGRHATWRVRVAR